MQVKPGGARISVDTPFYYREPLVDGAIATDGIQYSSIATVGTTAVEVFNKLIDPGVTVGLKNLYTSFTQKFTGLNGSFVGTVAYFWRAREEWFDSEGGRSSGVGTQRTGGWIPAIATIAKGVGTLTTSEDTITGYVPVASLPHAPLRVSLMAVGLRAAVVTGKVKNSSVVDLMGVVIPGT